MENCVDDKEFHGNRLSASLTLILGFPHDVPCSINLFHQKMCSELWIDETDELLFSLDSIYQ